MVACAPLFQCHTPIFTNSNEIKSRILWTSYKYIYIFNYMCFFFSVKKLLLLTTIFFLLFNSCFSLLFSWVLLPLRVKQQRTRLSTALVLLKMVNAEATLLLVVHISFFLLLLLPFSQLLRKLSWILKDVFLFSAIFKFCLLCAISCVCVVCVCILCAAVVTRPHFL